MSGDADRIADLGEFAGRRIPKLIEEAREQINEAVLAVVETADADEKDAILNIPIAIKWCLDNGKVEISLAVNLRRKFHSCGELPDRKQPKLPGLDEDSEGVVVLPNPELLASVYQWTEAAKMTPAQAFDWLNEVCEEKGLPPLADIRDLAHIRRLEGAVVDSMATSLEGLKLIEQARARAVAAAKAASPITVTMDDNAIEKMRKAAEKLEKTRKAKV